MLFLYVNVCLEIALIHLEISLFHLDVFYITELETFLNICLWAKCENDPTPTACVDWSQCC